MTILSGNNGYIKCFSTSIGDKIDGLINKGLEFVALVEDSFNEHLPSLLLFFCSQLKNIQRFSAGAFLPKSHSICPQLSLKSLFLGPYEHFYQDNFSGADFTTHYVVLGYQLKMDIDLGLLPDDQHHDYRWFAESELLQQFPHLKRHWT